MRWRSYDKKKKGYKNPLKRIKDKEKDTHGKRFNAPFVCVLMAERTGFEPAVRFRTPHFQCCTIDHSDTSPYNGRSEVT